MKKRVKQLWKKWSGKYPWLKSAKDAGLGAARRTVFGISRVLGRPGSRFGAAKGAYSDYQVVKEGAEGRIILEDQGAPEVPQRSLMVQSGLAQHLEQPWPVFWRRIKNARLVGPSLVPMDEQKRISKEAAYATRNDFRLKGEPSFNYLSLPPATHLDGRWTSIISRWGYGDRTPVNFCHWLLDALPRLALLPEFPEDTRILVPGKLAGYQLQTLEMLGVVDRCRLTVERHLMVEDYYFSSPPSMIVCWSPYAVGFLRDRLLSFAQPFEGMKRRFYIERRGVSRGAENEEAVKAFFLSHGWAVVDTATLSLPEQIALFANAEAICAMHGAAFTNLAWCKAGCKVLEIVCSHYPSGCYEWMAIERKLQYDFMMAPSTSNFQGRVDLAEMERRLCSMEMI